MPDMNEPGTYVAAEHERMKYKAMALRDEARTLITRAEIYEDCASYLRNAIDKEARRDATLCRPKQEA